MRQGISMGVRSMGRIGQLLWLCPIYCGAAAQTSSTAPKAGEQLLEEALRGKAKAQGHFTSEVACPEYSVLRVALWFTKDKLYTLLEYESFEKKALWEPILYSFALYQLGKVEIQKLRIWGDTILFSLCSIAMGGVGVWRLLQKRWGSGIFCFCVASLLGGALYLAPLYRYRMAIWTDGVDKKEVWNFTYDRQKPSISEKDLEQLFAFLEALREQIAAAKAPDGTVSPNLSP